MSILFQGLEALRHLWFKQQFFQLFVKGFHKGCMSILVFRCRFLDINIMFFKQLCHFIFKFRPIITLKYLGIFKHATFVIDCFQHKFNFAWFFGPKGSLYLDATSTPVKIYLYVFPSKTLSGIYSKSNWCCSLGFATFWDDSFPLRVVYEPATVLVLLTMAWCLFLA